jgi:hypothetical protein
MKNAPTEETLVRLATWMETRGGVVERWVSEMEACDNDTRAEELGLVEMRVFLFVNENERADSLSKLLLVVVVVVGLPSRAVAAAAASLRVFRLWRGVRAGALIRRGRGASRSHCLAASSEVHAHQRQRGM